jgi:hypothetical protein
MENAIYTIIEKSYLLTIIIKCGLIIWIKCAYDNTENKKRSGLQPCMHKTWTTKNTTSSEYL